MRFSAYDENSCKKRYVGVDINCVMSSGLVILSLKGESRKSRLHASYDCCRVVGSRFTRLSMNPEHAVVSTALLLEAVQKIR